MSSITRAVSISVAHSWEESLVTGNGIVGAMLFGEPGREDVILNRSGLFLPTVAPLDPPNLAPRLPEIRSLLAAGRFSDASAVAVEAGRECGMEGLIWTDPFVPAACLQFRSEQQGMATEYERWIDLETGEVGATYRLDGVRRRVSIVPSRPERSLLIRLKTDTVFEGLTVALGVPPLSDREQQIVDRFFTSVTASSSAASASLSLSARFAKRWRGSLTGYRVLASLASGAQDIANHLSETVDGAIALRDLNDVTIEVQIDLERDESRGTRSERNALPERDALAPRAMLLREETPVSHREYASRCTLDLGASAHLNKPVEHLQEHCDDEGSQRALFEKLFAAGRTHLVSAIGELPPTLTGIWGGSMSPVWSGDYTANGNLQTAIEALLPLGMHELLLPYFDYLEALLPDFRRNAERLYGARGIYVPSRMSSHGLMNHYNETYAHIFWVGGAAWAARFYFDYFRFTQDVQFLRERALPFLTEAALFYEDFLNGAHDAQAQVLTFAPSYSPENSPSNVIGDVQVTRNATIEIDLVRELLANLERAHDILGIETEDRTRWREMLGTLPPYWINADGAVSEWADPDLEDAYEHRHASHLYRLFYERPDVLDTEPALEAAFAAALGKRLEYRRRERAGTMAFGLVQLGHAAISLRDPVATEEILRWLADGYWMPALTSTHDRGSIFNTDICGGLPNLMARAFADGNERVIDLLPALPASWPDGRLAGLRLRGGWSCDLAWNNGRLSGLRLTGRPGGVIRVRCDGLSVELEARPGETLILDGDLNVRESRRVQPDP